MFNSVLKLSKRFVKTINYGNFREFSNTLSKPKNIGKNKGIIKNQDIYYPKLDHRYIKLMSKDVIGSHITDKLQDIDGYEKFIGKLNPKIAISHLGILLDKVYSEFMENKEKLSLNNTQKFTSLIHNIISKILKFDNDNISKNLQVFSFCTQILADEHFSKILLSSDLLQEFDKKLSELDLLKFSPNQLTEIFYSFSSLDLNPEKTLSKLSKIFAKLVPIFNNIQFFDFAESLIKFHYISAENINILLSQLAVISTNNLPEIYENSIYFLMNLKEYCEENKICDPENWKYSNLMNFYINSLISIFFS